MRVRFGDCEYDAEAYEVRRAGRHVDLSPKAFELLRSLIEARPRALSRAELHHRLWPGTFVADTSLPHLVADLRRGLGDSPRQSLYLRTVHRYGYAFCAPASLVEP